MMARRTNYFAKREEFWRRVAASLHSIALRLQIRTQYPAFLIAHDRGKYPRTPDGYRALAAPFFSNVNLQHRNDMLRVPYDHLMMTCSQTMPVRFLPARRTASFRVSRSRATGQALIDC